jgi:thiamine-phosphate pyrophosphorylase
MNRAASLYPIVDVPDDGAVPIEGILGLFREAGVEWFQLRDKRPADRARLELARRAAAAGRGLTFWYNDRPDLAVLAGADGVHVGQEDLPPAAIRGFAPRLRVGRSTHDADELGLAAADPAVDVVAVGPVFPSATKRGHARPVGLEGLRAARATTAKPLVAIGGVDPSTIGEVLATGADRVAVIGALSGATLAAVEARLAAMIAAIPEGRRA